VADVVPGAPRAVDGTLSSSPVRHLQPRGVGEILDGGFEVLRYRFVTLMAVTAIFGLPLYALPALLGVADRGHTDAFANQGTGLPGFGDGSTQNTSGLLSLLTLLGGALAIALIGVAVAHLVTSWVMGGDPTIRATLRHVASRSPVLVGAWVLAMLIKAAGVAVCFVGFIFVAPLLLVLAPVVSSERLGPAASVGRTWRLSRPRFASLLGLVVVSGIVTWVITVVLSLISLLVTQIWQDATWVWVVAGATSVVVRLLLLPLQAAWAALAYIDLRVRLEGLDLQLEADELFEVT
jgi:hypothetical protein